MSEHGDAIEYTDAMQETASDASKRTLSALWLVCPATHGSYGGCGCGMVSGPSDATGAGTVHRGGLCASSSVQWRLFAVCMYGCVESTSTAAMLVQVVITNANTGPSPRVYHCYRCPRHQSGSLSFVP